MVLFELDTVVTTDIATMSGSWCISHVRLKLLSDFFLSNKKITGDAKSNFLINFRELQMKINYLGPWYIRSINDLIKNTFIHSFLQIQMTIS